jgi:hypothetical protein
MAQAGARAQGGRLSERTKASTGDSSVFLTCLPPDRHHDAAPILQFRKHPMFLALSLIKGVIQHWLSNAARLPHCAALATRGRI